MPPDSFFLLAAESFGKELAQLIKRDLVLLIVQIAVVRAGNDHQLFRVTEPCIDVLGIVAGVGVLSSDQHDRSWGDVLNVTHRMVERQRERAGKLQLQGRRVRVDRNGQIPGGRARGDAGGLALVPPGRRAPDKDYLGL